MEGRRASFALQQRWTLMSPRPSEIWRRDFSARPRPFRPIGFLFQQGRRPAAWLALAICGIIVVVLWGDSG